MIKLPHFPPCVGQWKELQIIPLVAGYPARSENGVVPYMLKDVPDNNL